MSIRHCLSDLAHDKTIRDLQLLYSTFNSQKRISVMFFNVTVKEIYCVGNFGTGLLAWKNWRKSRNPLEIRVPPKIQTISVPPDWEWLAQPIKEMHLRGFGKKYRLPPEVITASQRPRYIIAAFAPYTSTDGNLRIQVRGLFLISANVTFLSGS
jgi:hypothetical protein